LGVAQQEQSLVAHPEPRVRFRRFGDSGLHVDLLTWIAHPEQRGRITHALNRAVLYAFREQNIHIPFPQHDVHITKEH